MAFFLTPWLITFAGWGVHVAVDRLPAARTPRRVVELLLLWVLVLGGAWALLGASGHLGPNSSQIAEGIGYAPSMFQWEVGWADVAIGVLGIGCAWRRDGWLTAAVVVLAICYWGDAIGHVMQYTVHDNTAPNNVWAIPSDILGPLLAVGLLIAYRRMAPKVASEQTVGV
jgi:hypothetical protein